MVLPILIAVIAAPGLLGTQEAIRQSQAKEKREEHRARRCNLIASCVKSSMRSREINGRPLVLKNGKLWIDTGTSDGSPYGHPYAGYYLPYPDSKYEGLVTTITDEAPIMNWIYVDKDTYEVKYGVRLDAQPNLTGPFDCTRQDRRLTFDDWEGWCAVEEFPTLWAVYFDMDDNGLKTKVGSGKRVLEIELTRKEKRWKKESNGRQQDQTTKREVDAKEDAPVDKPVTVEPQLNPPGVTDAPSQPQKYEPFPIPKSIFVDEPQFAPPPKTPPPAYNNTAGPSPTPPQRNTPPQGTQFSSSPPDSRRTPSYENRTTPKINRHSGTRALAQAQIFEALALGQRPNNDNLPRAGRTLSRPTSTTDSASEYSSGRMSTDVHGMYSNRHDENTFGSLQGKSATASGPSIQDETLSWQPQTPLAASDPAVFSGEYPSRLVEGGDPEAKDAFGTREQGSFEVSPNRTPRKRKTPNASLSSLTSPFTVRRPISSDKKVSNPANSERSGIASDIKAKNAAREQSRPGDTGTMPRFPTRNAAGASDNRPPPFSSKQQKDSTSFQNGEPSRLTPKPLARTNTTPVRKSMASTMTTGTRNRGMAYRIGSDSSNSISSPELPRTRTNSSLFREIDEMVNTGRRSGTPTGPGGRLRGSRDDGVQAPTIRRAATSRMPLRPNASSRPSNEKLRDADRDFGRRGDRDK